MPFDALDLAAIFAAAVGAAHRTRLVPGGEEPLYRPASSPDGWHEIVLAASVGARYRYRLTDDVAVPDPASRFNPDDVHGAS